VTHPIPSAALDAAGWRHLSSAPSKGNFIAAVWSRWGTWLVGEVEQDPDEPEKLWWANTKGDYHAEHLRGDGHIPVFWQPLPAAPVEPYSPVKEDTIP